MTHFAKDREIYEQVIRDRVPLFKKHLWIATADIKDMYVNSSGRDMVPFLKVLATLIVKGVEIRLIHAKEPGPNFRKDFDRYPRSGMSWARDGNLAGARKNVFQNTPLRTSRTF